MIKQVNKRNFCLKMNKFIFKKKKQTNLRTSLLVQWLRRHFPMQGAWVQSHIPCSVAKNKEINKNLK